MGILDSIQEAVSSASDSFDRGVGKMKLNNKLNDIQKQRQNLAAQLGASLYDATKDNAELREGREELYDGIAALDEEREQVQAEIQAIEDEAAAAAAAAAAANETLVCTGCGATVKGVDSFCTNCGKKVADIRAEIAAAKEAEAAAAAEPEPVVPEILCPACGAVVGETDLFCPKCGVKLQ